MKWMFLVVLLAYALIAPAQTVHKLRQYHRIKAFITDLNGDGKPDTIVLSCANNIWEQSNPGDEFNRITVALAGYQKKTFYARDYWTKIDRFFPYANKNAVNTHLFFLKKTEKQTVILLFGELTPAAYRDEFSIINIENNSVRRVMNAGDKEDIEIPLTLSDLEHNGRLCFIYRDFNEVISEKPNGRVESYQPFYVCPVSDSCKIDMTLTRRYNEQHYVYADFGHEVQVFMPKNGGRPRIYKVLNKTSQ